MKKHKNLIYGALGVVVVYWLYTKYQSAQTSGQGTGSSPSYQATTY